MTENQLHAAVTWYLTGLIWLVQVVEYPLFGYLDRGRFTEAHAFHTAAISWVVAPPMLLELTLAVRSVWQHRLDMAAWLGLALVALIWIVTFLVIVPMHERLGSTGFDAAIHASLVRWNWVRTVAWSLRAAIVFRLW